MRWSYFLFNDTATTEIYTLSLHDALPILDVSAYSLIALSRGAVPLMERRGGGSILTLTYLGSERVFQNYNVRSEEHTSELQSRQYIVCRLLLEKKNTHMKSSQANISESVF